MTERIIGRQEEQRILKEIYARPDADFLAVYGRRRVGKTHLLRNFFKSQRGVYFEMTGLKDGPLADQLQLFAEKVSEVFMDDIPIGTPKNWLAAFKILTDLIKKIPEETKVVILIDELPWYATPRSGFMQALDHYWNTRWSTRRNTKLIACGSAASFMLNKLIKAKGGLHNRLSAVISLKPYTLGETKAYLRSRQIILNDKQISEIYMVMGGIPHYLNGISPGLSPAQNINTLCFSKDGLLLREFSQLFSSLFNNSEAHEEIIRMLAASPQGLSRDEILAKAKHSSSGGMFKLRLSELEEDGFIVGFTPIGNRKKGTYYKVIDEYSLFYLRWIEPIVEKVKISLAKTAYWENKAQLPAWEIWSGYAFEAVCFKHIEQIKKALGIQAIACEIGSWRHVAKNEESTGAQIDLIIDRADGIINLCEIKYCQGKFVLSKKYADNLMNKLSVYQTHENTNKTIFITLVTPERVKENIHHYITISNEVLLTDLFL